MTIMQQVGAAKRLIDTSRDASEFVKLMICRVLAEKHQMPLASFVEAPGLSPSPKLCEVLRNPRLPMLIKNTVTPTSIADLHYTDYSTAFLLSLGAFSAFERIRNDNAFFDVQLRAFIRLWTSDPIGAIVGEAQPTPLMSVSADLKPLTPVKALALVACNQDLFVVADNVNFPGEALDGIGKQLRIALAREIDAAFLSEVTAGANSVSSTGLSASDVLDDLKSARRLIVSNANRRLYFIVPPQVFDELDGARTTTGALAFPGSTTANSLKIGSVTVLPSDGATSDGILIDASRVAAASGPLEPDESTEASLQLSDNPSADQSENMSLWQHNRIAFKLLRYLGCAPMGASVCTITGMISA